MGSKEGWLQNVASVDLQGPGVGRQFIDGWKHARVRNGKVLVRFYVGGLTPGRMTEEGCWTFAELRQQYKTFKRAKQWGSADILRHCLRKWGQLPRGEK